MFFHLKIRDRNACIYFCATRSFLPSVERLRVEIGSCWPESNFSILPKNLDLEWVLEILRDALSTATKHTCVAQAKCDVNQLKYNV